MNIIGHVLIACSVRENVYRATGVRLSFSGFLNGNVLPDISAKYGKNPHYFKSSYGFVINRMRRLRDVLEVRRLGSYRCSLSAGVITHYLSDFFCYAHSECCTYDIYRHHWYELCMLWRFPGGLLLCGGANLDGLSRGVSPESYLSRCEEDYIGGCKAQKRDFYYAVKVSSQILIDMVEGVRCRGEDGLSGYEIQSCV